MLPSLVIAAAVAVAAGGSFAALAKRAFPGGTAAVPREITVSRTAPVLPAGTPVHLLAVSDLHYISPKLNDGGEFFRRTVENADGKLTERSEEFLAALEAQTLKERPDALVISGDLTFNGEHQSLRDLKETFGRIREKGVTVLVLPGNHDVSYPMAVNFTGKGTERVKNVSQAEFLEECREFGYGAAEEKDRASFSYYYPLSEDLPGFIFELKHTKEDADDLDQLADAAMEQIDEKKYDAEMCESGIKEIIKVGIAFHGKNVSVKP